MSSPSKAPASPLRGNGSNSGRLFSHYLICFILTHTFQDRLCLPSKPCLILIPYSRYANLMARHPRFKSTTVNPPNVRDRNGAIILPSDDSVKLGDQTPVFATVKLYLGVLSSTYFLLLLKVSARWEISPQNEEKRASSGFKSLDGKENGSRIQVKSINCYFTKSLLPARSSTRMPSSRTRMKLCKWILLMWARGRNAC